MAMIARSSTDFALTSATLIAAFKSDSSFRRQFKSVSKISERSCSVYGLLMSQTTPHRMEPFAEFVLFLGVLRCRNSGQPEIPRAPGCGGAHNRSHSPSVECERCF